MSIFEPDNSPIDATKQMRARDTPKEIKIAAYALAGVALLFAIGHVWRPERFDETSALFLVVAIVALIVPRISKFTLGKDSVSFETVAALEEAVRDVEKSVSGLEKDVGPGSKSAIPIIPPSRPGNETPAAQESDDDPNKGRFGGKPEANGRRLSARITPDAGPRSARCRVDITVESTEPTKPLSSEVEVFLHPTFGRYAKYKLEIEDGVAKDSIVSYGAFTIGVAADEGKTRLELDLMDVRGGTRAFYTS